MKKMRFNLMTISALLLSVLLFTACSKEEGILSETLTVEEVILGNGFSLKSVKMINENGIAVINSGDPNSWFENATVQEIIVPAGAVIGIDHAPDGQLQFRLASIILVDFQVDKKSYSIGMGPGRKLVVQKNKAGKYILLPEETASLSPPPVVN